MRVNEITNNTDLNDLKDNSRAEADLVEMVNKLYGEAGGTLPVPKSRMEFLLHAIYEKLGEGGGSVDPADIETVVRAWFEEHSEAVATGFNVEFVDDGIEFTNDQMSVEEAVAEYLDDHPEATTTVQDGAISYAKLDSGLKGSVDDVSDLKSHINDPVTGLDTKAPVIIDTASGAIVSFPDGMAAPAKDVSIGIEPVQSGSGDPSPDNVRPISGWTGAKVTRTGKNLYDANAIHILSSNGVTVTVNNGVITFNGTATADAFFSALETGLLSGEYVFSFNNPVASNGVHVSFRTTSGVYFSDTGASEVNKSVTIRNEPNDVILYVTSGTTLTNFVVRPQLEPGTTATDYEPYAGDTFDIAFPPEAGTVYGGTLDVTTGLLMVERAMVDCSSITTWTIDKSAQRIYKIRTDMKPNTEAGTIPGLLCNCFKTITPNDIYRRIQGVTISTGSALQLHIDGVTDDPDITLAKVSQWFADNPTTVCYELATPQTYQLTPTEVEMLLGENNVWADTGDMTVTYRADTKLYIQKINAPTDDDMIADAQIASGRYFIVGGNLYKSTTTIPAGDTINPGSNCILTNLADALNALST